MISQQALPTREENLYAHTSPAIPSRQLTKSHTRPAKALIPRPHIRAAAKQSRAESSSYIYRVRTLGPIIIKMHVRDARVDRLAAARAALRPARRVLQARAHIAAIPRNA